MVRDGEVEFANPDQEAKRDSLTLTLSRGEREFRGRFMEGHPAEQIVESALFQLAG